PGVPAFTHEEELLDGILTRTTAVAPDPRVATLVRMLARHRFDWSQPLSMKRFESWRGALAHKRDFVTDQYGSPHIILRTTTEDDGDLHEVELTVERDSYR